MAATPTSGSYISNPFRLLWLGTKLIGTNIQTMFVVIGLSIALVLTLLPGVLVIAVGASLHSSATIIIGIALLVAGVIALIMYGIRFATVVYLLYFGNARGEEHTFREYYAQAKPIAWRLAGLTVVVALIVIGGFLLLIVPGLIFTYRYSLAAYAMLDENLSVGQSLKRSRELVRGHGWEMFGLIGAIDLLTLIEYIPFVGFIIAIVLSWAAGNARVVRYLQLKELKTGDSAPVPAVSGWNYVAIFVGPAVFALIFLVSIVHDMNK